MAINSGITIGDKHTYRDFGLLMSSYYIPEPEPKVKKVEIPYTSGSIDLTEAVGEVTYSDRTGLEFVFGIKDDGHIKFSNAVQKIAAHIHGKKLELISDYDPDYFYVARLEVDAKKTSRTTGQIVLKGESEPFKYSRYASGSDWLWDPFSFVDGVITSLTDVVINNGGSVPLTPAEFYTVPEFDVKTANNLKVKWNGVDYSLKVGKNYFPQIRVKGISNALTFTGSGTMDIDFRGKYL